jgi:dipeptide/tripeptide permease
MKTFLKAPKKLFLITSIDFCELSSFYGAFRSFLTKKLFRKSEAQIL